MMKIFSCPPNLSLSLSLSLLGVCLAMCVVFSFACLLSIHSACHAAVDNSFKKKKVMTHTAETTPKDDPPPPHPHPNRFHKIKGK